MNEVILNNTYTNIFGLPIGMRAINEHLNIGPVHITIANNSKSYYGRLHKNGVISGLSQLFYDHNLKSGMRLYFENYKIGSIKLYINKEPSQSVSDQPSVSNPPSEYLKWPHNEIFDINNFKRWHPTSEFDVCFVFGALQEMTDYNYCCAINHDIASKIEYFKTLPSAKTKPDAILRHKHTNAYLIAKFESNSSNYKKHCAKNDVDVLIVWRDDESNRSCLPMHIVELYKLAQKAANNAS